MSPAADTLEDGHKIVVGLDQLHEAEVEHLHATAGGQLDIGGLQVAMDDPPFVCGADGAGDRQRQLEEALEAGEEKAGDLSRVAPGVHLVGDVGKLA